MQDKKRWDEVDAACRAALDLQDTTTLTSPETIRAWMQLGYTDRKRAEMSILDAAKKLQKKTEVGNILKAAAKEFIQNKKEQNANKTQFSTLTEQLSCGNFRADDEGIYATLYSTDMQAEEKRICSHPLYPVEYCIGVEDGIHRVKLAFIRDGLKHITVECETIASRQAIVMLARYGIDVTTETAKYLVDYLADIRAQNEGRIPNVRSIGRLGWVGQDFAPFIDDIKFDGEDSYRELFQSIHPVGNERAWMDMARKTKGHARLVLAAAFAAPLVGKLDGQPFFVHLWGGTEAGKTVAMMVAASVWGDPKLGGLTRTFSSTGVGMELTAGFLRNIPVCLDELETSNADKDFDKTIYMLGEGQGKTRGQKTGGLQKTHTWRTVIISNGEHPITSSRSRGGARNRVLEAECIWALFENPAAVADLVKENYGHAGQKYIEAIQRIGIDSIREMYAEAVHKVRIVRDSTEKQRNAAAFLLLGDQIATAEFFDGQGGICEWDLEPLLMDAAEVKTFQRGLEYLRGWYVTNRDKFLQNESQEQVQGNSIYGRVENNGYVAIVGNIFDDAMSSGGFSGTAFLADADAAGMLQKGTDGKRKKVVRFGPSTTRCVVINLDDG